MSETNETVEEATPAKGKKMIVAILLIAGVAIGGGAGAFLAGPLLAEKVIGPAAPAAGAGAHGDSTAHGEEAEHEEESGGHGEGAVAAVYQIDNLVLNPAHSGGTRFLMLTVAFDLKDAAAVEQMKVRDAEVRDAILTVIGSKTVEQLVDISARNALKGELKNSVGQLFSKGAVKQIYLPQFVIQ